MNWEYKIVRDPLYGYIGLTEQEVELIQTRFFQRLRRIKQLGFTELVYPSAVHSRFEHSLGVLFIADKIAQQIHLEDSERQIIRITALLHDIGQGPFSHVFENVLKITNDENIDHVTIGLKIIESDNEISRILGEYKGRVIDILSNEESVSHDIISSALDADKLDYLRRDSYHIGVMYGVFDMYRILHMLDTDKDRKHLAAKEKAKDALESFRLARYLMHTQVYQHHVRAIADAMFTRAAEIALSEGLLDKDLLNYKNKQFLSYFFSLDDASICNKIKNSRSPYSKAKKLIEALENRDLFKISCLIHLDQISDYLKKSKLARMDKLESRQLEKKIFDEYKKQRNLSPGLFPLGEKNWLNEKFWDNADFIIIYPQRIENPLYREPYQIREETPILIKMDNNEIKSLDDISPITGAVQKYIDKIYVFCPDDGKSKEEADSLRKIINKIAYSILLGA